MFFVWSKVEQVEFGVWWGRNCADLPRHDLSLAWLSSCEPESKIRRNRDCSIKVKPILLDVALIVWLEAPWQSLNQSLSGLSLATLLENQGAALPRHPWTNQCWYYYTNVDDCAGFTSFTIWVSLDHGITCTCRHRNNLLASLNISMLASSGCSRCCSDRGRMIRAVVTLWFSQIQFSQTPLLLLREDGHEGIHA